MLLVILLYVVVAVLFVIDALMREDNTYRVVCRIAVILTPLLRRIHLADRVKWGWVQLHKFGHIGVAGRALVVGETRVIAPLGRNESLFHVSAVSCFVAH